MLGANVKNRPAGDAGYNIATTVKVVCRLCIVLVYTCVCAGREAGRGG